MTKTLEEYFLKIFKVVVLAVMSALLIATIVLLIIAFYNLTTQPIMPSPVKEPPKSEIKIEDFIKSITPEESPSPASSVSPQQKTKPISRVLPYQEQAKQLYECAQDFGKKANISIATKSNEEIAIEIEGFRAQLERASEPQAFGEAWTVAVTEFICVLSVNQKLIDLRKAGKVEKVIYPAINFHHSLWGKNLREKNEFVRMEEMRFASEQERERLRVIGAREMARLYGAGAAGAFLAFMCLALYLLLAKAETNLRSIAESQKGGA